MSKDYSLDIKYNFDPKIEKKPASGPAPCSAHGRSTTIFVLSLKI